MIDAQSIVVASTATRWYGHEGSILRFDFPKPPPTKGTLKSADRC